jgi:hypothetical protein
MSLKEKFLFTLASNSLKWVEKLLTGPAQIEKNGIAEARVHRIKMLLDAKTKNDIQKFEQGLIEIDDNGEIVSLENAIAVMLDDEKKHVIKQKLNLLSTTEKAYNLLEDNSEEQLSENHTDIDSYWFERWREEAEKANTDNVQNLWAKILNQEMRTPKSVSLRTMSFIKDLSKEEAKLIELIISTSFEDFVVYDIRKGKIKKSEAEWSTMPNEDNSLLIQIGVTYDQIFELNELGIISGVSLGGFSRNILSRSDNKYLCNICVNNEIMTIVNDDANICVELCFYRLTAIGVELKNILKLNDDKAYYDLFLKKIKDLGFELTVSNN